MKRGVPLLIAATLVWCAACAHAHAPVPAGGSTAPERPSVVDAASLDPGRDIVLAVADPLAPPSTHAGSNLLGYVRDGHYGGAGMHAALTLTTLQRNYGWRELKGWPIKSLRLYCVVVEPPRGMQRETLLKQLAGNSRVQLAEPLHGYSVYSGPPPAPRRYNDPYVGLERGFIDTDAARAHAFSQGRGVDIAVVDTGADMAHPDLRGQLRGVHDEVNQDPDPSKFDSDAHGTEVAGVIAAIGNNHIGIVGMAPEATLSVYRACWYAPESGAGARCNSFTLAKALAAVMDNTGARIVNMSLGGPADPLLARLLEQLLDRDRIVIAAMPPDGNLGGFPDSVPGVITVRASRSSQAPPGVLSAPGHDILTTQPGGGYDFVSGSSMAAAQVSGIAALLLSISPDMRAPTLRDLLLRTSQVTEGVLQVNAAAAVTTLRDSAASHHE
ncbi:MAG: S8 family serine peptidase [Xanthomonadaceae bacterium]|nr:S8 family serine peptidase [Xanthomonadaceae bacterium]HJR11516.1 S8 family serine peptidase [Rhodanobacteraceae bacterium]